MGLSLFLLCYCVQITSSTEKTVGLTKALKLGIENSHSLKTAFYDYRLTKTKQGEAARHFLPSINANWERGIQTNDTFDNENSRTPIDTKSISLKQKIFTGYEATFDVKSSSQLEKSAFYELQNKYLDICLEIISTFLDLKKQQEMLSLQKETVALSKKIMIKVSERQYLKVISKNEVSQYEMDTLRYQSELLDLQKQFFEMQTKFKLLINRDYMPEKTPSEIPREVFDFDSELTAMKKTHPELLKTQSDIKIARYEKGKTHSRFLPQISLIGTYKKQENVIYLNERDLENTQLYINIDVPLFESGQRFNEYNKAEFRVEGVKQENKLKQQELHTKLNQLIQQFNTYFDLIKASEELVNLAQEKVDSLSREVSLGTSDILALLIAKQELNSIKKQNWHLHQDQKVLYYSIKVLSQSNQFLEEYPLPDFEYRT